MSDDYQTALFQMSRAIFYPRQDMPYGPEAPGAFDDIFEVADGVRLRSRFFLSPDKSSPNILFFHGNGETARDYDYFAEAYRALPVSLIVAEYRGYGPSSGQPSFETFLSDAHRCLDRTREVLGAKGSDGPLVVMGRSLGSAPAIELGCTRSQDVSALIVESGFADVIPLLELLGLPANELGITEDFGSQNRSKMSQVTLPTLIIHAELDQIIPINEGEGLFDACQDPKKAFLRVPGAGHNDVQAVAGSAYFESIKALLARTAR